MRMARVAVPLALLLGAGAAHAHDADIIYTQVRRTEPGSPEVRARLTLTASTLSLLLPADADGDGAVSQADLDARRPALEVGIWEALPLTAGGQPCTRQAHAARLVESYVELTATFQCPPGALRQTYTVLSVLPANYRVVLGTYGGSGRPALRGRGAAEPGHPRAGARGPEHLRPGLRGLGPAGDEAHLRGHRSPGLPDRAAAGGRQPEAGAGAW